VRIALTRAWNAGRSPDTGWTGIRPVYRPHLVDFARPPQPPPALLRLPRRRQLRTGGRKQPGVSEDDRFFLLLCGMCQLLTAPQGHPASAERTRPTSNGVRTTPKPLA